MLEGVLNNDQNTKKHAKLIRMLEIDLETSETKTYAYQFDYDQYDDSSKVKIGDISAIDNENFIIIEQGPGKNGNYRNIIYKINIENATDVSKITLDSQKELEHLRLQELKDIMFISKKLILTPKDYGWKEKKLEGLTIIDSKTIAITNDNDFGVKGYKITPNPCADCLKLLADIDKSTEETNLWIIRFKNEI